MKGQNFHHANVVGLALATQSLSAATGTGATISEPWRIGRQISFIAVGGAFAASASGRLRVFGLSRSDGTTWVALKENDGTTNLEFLPTLYDDAGLGEGAALLGTIPLSDVDGTTYEAIRVTFESEGAQAMLIGIAYVISDLHEYPSGQVDYLFDKAHG
jgi:hypothetical protein